MAADDTLTLSFTRKAAHELLKAILIMQTIAADHVPDLTFRSDYVMDTIERLEAFIEGREPELEP